MTRCDHIKPSDYAFMGYSIRTATRRFTNWVRVQWEASSSRLLPQWTESSGQELYDHRGDTGEAFSFRAWENENLARRSPAAALELDRRLRSHFDAAQLVALKT